MSESVGEKIRAHLARVREALEFEHKHGMTILEYPALTQVQSLELLYDAIVALADEVELLRQRTEVTAT